jgi:hypothetical protein
MVFYDDSKYYVGINIMVINKVRFILWFIGDYGDYGDYGVINLMWNHFCG